MVDDSCHACNPDILAFFVAANFTAGMIEARRFQIRRDREAPRASKTSTGRRMWARTTPNDMPLFGLACRDSPHAKDTQLQRPRILGLGIRWRRGSRPREPQINGHLAVFPDVEGCLHLEHGLIVQ